MGVSFTLYIQILLWLNYCENLNFYCIQRDNNKLYLLSNRSSQFNVHNQSVMCESGVVRKAHLLLVWQYTIISVNVRNYILQVYSNIPFFLSFLFHFLKIDKQPHLSGRKLKIYLTVFIILITQIKCNVYFYQLFGIIIY